MSSSNYERYVQAVENISLLAQKELEELWERLPKDDKLVLRDMLLELVPAIADKYGDLAALAAAEYYEAERRRQIGGDYRATLAPATEEDREALLESIRYACGYLFEGDADDR